MMHLPHPEDARRASARHPIDVVSRRPGDEREPGQHDAPGSEAAGQAQHGAAPPAAAYAAEAVAAAASEDAEAAASGRCPAQRLPWLRSFLL